MNWAPYQGARTCTGSPTPGARALQAWLSEAYQGYSLGIYNCRSVRGGSTTSLHGEGRALDWGLRMPAPGRANPVGHTILRHLAAHGARLGIQCIIWDRRIYSAASPNGRYYGGVSPHYDHLHIELTWDAARNLTLATLRAVLSGGQIQPAPRPTTRSRCMYMAWHKGVVYLFSHDDRGLPVRRGWGMNKDEIDGFKAMGVPLGGEVNEAAFKACRAIWI